MHMTAISSALDNATPPAVRVSSLPTKRNCDCLSVQLQGSLHVTVVGDHTAKDKIEAAPFCQYETARQGCGDGLGRQDLVLAGGWQCHPLVWWAWMQVLAGRHGTTPA